MRRCVCGLNGCRSRCRGLTAPDDGVTASWSAEKEGVAAATAPAVGEAGAEKEGEGVCEGGSRRVFVVSLPAGDLDKLASVGRGAGEVWIGARGTTSTGGRWGGGGDGAGRSSRAVFLLALTHPIILL